MRRRGAALVGASLVLVVGAPTTAAGSDWSPWTRYVNQPFSFRDCGTTVRVTFPVNQEVQRTRRDAGGNTIIEVKGPARLRFAPASPAMHSITRDASGPSRGEYHQIAFRNGDYLFAATGSQWTIFEHRSELRGTGLPLAFVSSGPFRILFKADQDGVLNQPADVITRPPQVENICRLMQ